MNWKTNAAPTPDSNSGAATRDPRPALRRPSARHRSRRGLTIVEMLVAMAASLIMIYGMVLTFSEVGQQVSDGRASIEMDNQLRSVLRQVERDLKGLTVPVRPWDSQGAADGYFEYIEGLGNDNFTLTGGAYVPTLTASNGIIGDRDDWLSFTTRNDQEPFVGQLVVYPAGINTAPGAQTTFTSQVAEVVYGVLFNDTDAVYGDATATATVDPQELNLCRRALLVRPDVVGLPTFQADVSSNASLRTLRDNIVQFYNTCDLSARPEVSLSGSTLTVQITANSLSDLSTRRNRFGRVSFLLDDGAGNITYMPNMGSPPGYYWAYPYPSTDNPLMTPSLSMIAYSGPRIGESVVLTNAIGFDVKAFDPFAPLRADHPTNPARALAPGEPGFEPRAVSGNSGTPVGAMVGRGAYVDLYYDRFLGGYPLIGALGTPLMPTLFSGPPSYVDANNNGHYDAGEPFRGIAFPVYDTWSSWYEQNGLDEDGDGSIDEGTDGLDYANVSFPNGTLGVDDPTERETAPPYIVPLRGLKVSVRTYDVDTRQQKQRSLVQDFLPE